MLNHFFHDIAHVIFPKKCVACSGELSVNEHYLCSICYSALRPTRFHLYEDPTPFDKLFWGRVQVESTYAHYYFDKKSPIQSLLFTLKYDNGELLGTFYGREIGSQLKDTSFFSTESVLIPVPLHPKKEFLRGYNQSLCLAKGISSVCDVRLDPKCVKRNENNSTQTRKNRFQRWDNVEGIFLVKDTIASYKHIVLVDDVITTGSTLESLIQQIKSSYPDLRISVITLAIA